MRDSTKLIIGITLLLLALAGMAALAFGQSPLNVGPGDVGRMAVWDVASLAWKPWTLLGYGLTANLYTGPGDVARLAYWNGTAWQEWNGSVPIGWLSAGNWKVFYSNGSGVVQQLSLPVAYYYLQGNGAAAAPTWVNVLRPARVTTTAGPDTFGSLIIASTNPTMTNCTRAFDIGGTDNFVVNVIYGGIVAGYMCKMYPDVTTVNRLGSGIFGGSNNRNDGWCADVIVAGMLNYIDSTVANSVIAGGDRDSIISDGSTNDDMFMGGGVLNKFDHSHTSGLMGGAHAYVCYSPYFFGGGGDYDSTVSSRYSFNIGGRVNKLETGDTSGNLGGTHNYVLGYMSYNLGGYFDSLLADWTYNIGGHNNKLTGEHSTIINGDSCRTAKKHGYAFGRRATALHVRSAIFGFNETIPCSTEADGEFYVSGGTIRIDSVRMNTLGGHDCKVFNGSGANLYRGQILETLTNGGGLAGYKWVTKAGAGDMNPVGTVFDAGIADGDWGWMTFSGPGYVAVLDAPTATVINGDRVLAVSAGTAGLADCYTLVGVPVHDREVGHPFSDGIIGQNTSPTTDDLCIGIIHFR